MGEAAGDAKREDGLVSVAWGPMLHCGIKERLSWEEETEQEQEAEEMEKLGKGSGGAERAGAETGSGGGGC